MITISVENDILRKVLCDALSLAFGQEQVQEGSFREGAHLLIEDSNSESYELSIKNAAGELLEKMVLPLRSSDFLEKCRTFLKLETVPKLEKNIIIQEFSFKPIDFLLIPNDGGESILLTEKERNILVFLAGKQGNAVTKDDLLHQIWNYAPGLETHTLETHIYRLRQKIEKDPTHPKILVTKDDGYLLLMD